MRVFLAALLLMSCGLFEPEDKQAKEPTVWDCLEKVQPVRDTYMQLLPTIADSEGWYETTECDALLFNSLVAAGGVDINIPLARDVSGKWFRRPAKDCFATGHSQSEISRDMYIGLIFWAFLNERVDILEGIYQYGSANGWIMGEGAISRTLMTPGLQATLADAIFALGGADHEERKYPQAWYCCNTNFAAHLDVLHILLRGYINGGISDTMASVLAEQYNRDINNPLFAFAWAKYHTGDYTIALQLLDNDALWPKDRLPTSDNYCDSWPMQRDPNTDDWAPCPEEGKTHTGGGLVLLTELIEKELGL